MTLGELTFSGDEIRIDNNGYLLMVPKNADGTLMNNTALDAILSCNGLATAVILDSTATDDSANDIANSKCLSTSQWQNFINSVLAGD
jgi:hypothetical protein